MKRLMCIHGYGVRGAFWRHIRPDLDQHFGQIDVPDLTEESWKAREDRLARDLEAAGSPVTLLGHSMGSVMAAQLAQRLGPKVVRAAVLIAPPFGPRSTKGDGLTRFLVRYRLIPPFVTRPMFYTRTPVPRQKEDYRLVVPEPRGIMDLLFGEEHFHTSWFTRPLEQPSLVICSDADQVVPADKSVAFATVLGSRIHRRPVDDGIGHNDFTASPSELQNTAKLVAELG